MHPNPAFRDSNDDALIAAADVAGFAHLFIATPDGPMVAHAPIVMAGDRAVRFHVARANRIHAHLDGAQMIASVTGVDGYITPNWYQDARSQVPTWNYVSIELQGSVIALDEDGLIDQLDRLAARHEPRVIPDNPWTRDKMDESRFRAMLRAIAGFELRIERVCGTTKLSQNKSETDRAQVINGLRASGNAALADVMQARRR